MQEYYIYLRKSRADSPLESVEEVLAKHELMLQELARKKLGYEIDEKHILREVVSGETISDRPKMIKLLQLIEQEDVKAVLVIEPQRLTRGDLEDCGRIVNAFRYTRTLIYTLNIDYDLSDKMQRKFFEQELMRGNDYLEYTKEILERGRILSVKKGNYLSRFCPFGYNKIRDEIGPTLEPDENAWAVPVIFDQYVNQGKSYAKIAHYLDELGVRPEKTKFWEPWSVKAIIENPHYTGIVRYGYRKIETILVDGKVQKKKNVLSDAENVIIVQGRHKALISDEIFKAAQEKMNRNPRRKTGLKIANPFAGLIFCKKCGKALFLSHPTEPRRRRIECRRQGCKSFSVLYSEVEEVIYSTLLNVSLPGISAKSEGTSDDYEKIIEAQIKQLEKELFEMQEQEEKQYTLLEKGFYSEAKFTQRHDRLVEDMNSTAQKIENLKEKKRKKIDYACAEVKLKEALEALKDDSVTAEVKNKLLKSVVKKIELEQEENERKCKSIKIDLLL